MKVLLLSQFFSSTRGGGEYVFSTIAKKLVENNHEVWVITNRIKDEYYITLKNVKNVIQNLNAKNLLLVGAFKK